MIRVYFLDEQVEKELQKLEDLEKKHWLEVFFKLFGERVIILLRRKSLTLDIDTNVSDFPIMESFYIYIYILFFITLLKFQVYWSGKK